MSKQEFRTTIEALGSKVIVPIPFDPATAWGARQRYHVTGTINEHTFRGGLETDGARYFLAPGPAWRRDSKLGVGDSVTVVLMPEGPLQDNVADDIAAALAADSTARGFFESLPTFYRKNYMRWIDSAKRAETRAARIAEMMTLLQAGKRER